MTKVFNTEQNVLYLDLSDGFIIFQNLSNDTLQICAFYCM